MAKKKKKIYNAITGEFETQSTTSKKSSTSSVSKGYDATKGSFYDIAPVKEVKTPKKKEDDGLLSAFNDGYDFGDVTKSILKGGKKLAVGTYKVGKETVTNPIQTAKTVGVGVAAGIDKADESINNAVGDFFDWITRKDDKDKKYSLSNKEFTKLTTSGTEKEKQEVLKKYAESYGEDSVEYKNMKAILGAKDTRSDTQKTIDNILNPKYYETDTYEAYKEGKLSDGQKTVWGVSENIGNMIPSIAVSTVTGNPALGSAVFFTQAQQNYTEEAKTRGYTDTEARTYGLIMGGAEVLVERLGFDELGGLSKLSGGSIKKAMAGEGLEEFVMPYIDSTVKSVGFDEEFDLQGTTEEALESAVMGAVTGGIMNAGGKGLAKVDNFINKVNSGQEITQNDLVEAAREIEETDPNYFNEIMRDVPQVVRDQIQNENIAPIEQTEDIAPVQESTDTEVQQVVDETQDLEKTLRSQNYQYKAQSTDSVQRRTISEDASKYANNTTRTHEFVDTVVNVSEATGETIRLTNNQSEEMVTRRKQLAENYARINNVTIEEATKRFKNTTIDAYNTGKEIVINLDSPKALNRLVGHEVTHSLEGTKEYSKLQKIAIEYDKTKGEYNDRVSTLQALYEGTNANINNELISDIVGDYLFTDQQFVNQIHTQDRNLFQRIYDEIKHLIKMATAGSKEARQLEQLKHSFEKAMRENKQSSKSEVSQTTTQESKSNLATEVESNTQEKEKQVTKIEKKETKKEETVKETKKVEKKEERVETNIGAIPIEEYRDIAAMQSGFDSYEEMQKEGYRIGNEYDKKSATPTQTELDSLENTRQNKSGSEYALEFFALRDKYGEANLYKGLNNYKATGKALEQSIKDNTELYNKIANERQIVHMGNALEILKEGSFSGSIAVQNRGLKPSAYKGSKEGIVFTPVALDYVNKNKLYKGDGGNTKLSDGTRTKENPNKHTSIEGFATEDTSKRAITKYNEGIIERENAIPINTETVEYIIVNNETSNPELMALAKEKGFEVKFLNDNRAVYTKETKVSDNKGRALTKEQQDYFKNSKVRDENGNLLTMYHGTSSGGHTVFDPWGAKVGLFGQGSYFTDNQSVAESYTEKGRGSNKQIYEVYLNITNPIDMDAQGDVQAWAKALSSYGTDIASHLESGTNEQIYRSALDYLAEEGTYDKYERAEIMAETFEKMGYDGITHIGGGRFNKQDGTRHRVYISLDSTQVKNVDNINPTQDADIRYSLSEDNLKQKQLDIILKTNPMQDDYHVGIRSIEDIKTFDETINDDESFVWGDFSQEDAKMALEKGKITVYSSYPIEQGVFVSTSKNQARDYAGGGKVYSKTIPLNEVAWINGDEGQYAKVNNIQYSLSEVPLEQRVTGDELLDAQDLIEELESVGAKIDANGYVTVYHATTQENARKINESKQMKSNEPAVFFSTSKNAQQSEGRGGATLEFRIPVEKLVLDDLFSDNADVKIPLENFYTDTLDVTDYLVTNDYSLSNENTDIAPTSADIFGSEIKLQEQVQEAIAPLQETIQELNNKITTLQESIAPVEGFTDEDVSLKNDRNFESLENQNIAPVENTTPEYQYENSNEETPITDPFENRDIKEVGNRKVKAYMYENPEVKPYFQQAAREMLSDLDNSIKGEKIWLQELNPATGLMENNLVTGTQRMTTSDIAELLDVYHYTYAEIRKGLNAIIEDNGKENNAVSKRIEFMLNDRLLNGYTAIDGYPIPPSNEYRALIQDKNIQEYSEQAYAEWNNSINRDELAPIENASNTNTEAQNVPLENNLPMDDEITDRIEKTLSNEPKIKNTKYDDPMSIFERQIGREVNEGMTYTKSKPKVSKPKKQLLQDAYGKAQEQFVNRNYYIDKMAKDTGNNQIKFAGDMLNNFYAEIDGDIFTAQTDNNGNAIGDSLSSLFEKSKQGGYYEAFNDYLMHQSNIDRHQVGKGSIVPQDYSRKMVAEYEKMYPTMRAEATKVWKYGKNQLANMQSNGLITGQFNSMLQKMYPHYVPFAFDQEFIPSMSEDGVVRPKKAIKRAEGNAYEILEIEEAFAKYTYRTKRAIRENSLLKEVVKSSKDKVSIGADVRTDPTNLEEGYGIDDNGKYYATAYVNGEMQQATISEELYNELTKSAENRIKDAEQRYELITKPLQAVSEVRRKVLTQWNPMFIARNMLMDPQDAVLNSKYPTQFLKYYPTALAELAQANTKEAKQFLTLYGSGNTMGEFNSDKITQTNAKNKSFMGKVSQVGNLVELAPRYAEFKATIKDGKSVQEAMYNAREVTTNFGRGGYITKALNRNGFTFLNTSVQGFDKLVRNFSGENGARGVVSSLAKVSAFAVIPALFNALSFDDDEEYEALPDYIKDNYYLFKTGDGEFIRIHKGRMVSVFGSAGRRTLEYINGNKDAFDGFLSNAYKQVGVQNPLDNNILAPLIQAYNNEAWYGGDLVPTRLQDKPAEEQYDETTDEFSKWLGQQFGISPYKINYVLEQYSGGVGDILLPMITEGATSDSEGLETLLAPMKDQFTANTTSDNKYVSEFYDTNDKLKAKANSSNATEEDILRNKYMYSVSSEMSELYQEKREVQNDKTLTKSEKYEKVQEIQKQINSLAEEGLNNYEKINKTSNYAMVGDREFYKNANDEWKTPYDDELDELNSLGMDIEEKSNYYDAKNSIYEITEEYKGTEDMYAEKKAKIIDVVKNSSLTDDQKGYLYSKYYSKEKVQIINALDMNFNSFLDYESQNFVADKNAKGESINGSKKTKVFNYINSMNGLSFEEKVILAKLEYNTYDEWNYEIINYLNNSSITYEEEVYILKKLGFVVDNEGNIYWK